MTSLAEWKKGRDDILDGKYTIISLQKLCYVLYEARTFFFQSRQGGIPIETDRIPTKVGQKSAYKCFFEASLWIQMLTVLKMRLKVANEYAQK